MTHKIDTDGDGTVSHDEFIAYETKVFDMWTRTIPHRWVRKSSSASNCDQPPTCDYGAAGVRGRRAVRRRHGDGRASSNPKASRRDRIRHNKAPRP